MKLPNDNIEIKNGVAVYRTQALDEMKAIIQNERENRLNELADLWVTTEIESLIG